MSGFSRFLCLFLPALAILISLTFRGKRWVRTVAVVLLTMTLVGSIHFGLRLAARNVPMPSSEQLKQNVTYADAWNTGRLATQRNVDAYQITLLSSIFALAVLSLIPLAPAVPRGSSTAATADRPARQEPRQ